jgi:hypothetical protein
MAQKRDSTPEKQLLNLIENPDEKGASTKKRAKKHKGLSIFSPGAWRGRLSFLKEGLKKGGGLSQIDIKAVNGFLLLSIFLLVGYLASTVYFSVMELEELPGLKAGLKEGFKTASIPAESVMKAASYYISKINDRNIFKMGSRPVLDEDITDVIIEAPSDTIREMTQHLRLVGISWSSNPDAMIEDTQALRTFFVKRGQMIGEIKVEAIFKDKVVLSYGEQEIELK